MILLNDFIKYYNDFINDFIKIKNFINKFFTSKFPSPGEVPKRSKHKGNKKKD